MSAILSKEEGKCKWFSLCDNEAITELPHPVLGLVPICDRCLAKTMSMTEWLDYEGPFTAPMILYKLVADHNVGVDDLHQAKEPFHAGELWNLDMGELLAIQGVWKEVKLDDPRAPDWRALNISDHILNNKNGVRYIDDYMVIQGDDGDATVFWVFKKEVKKV
jgi:hypothetical protein